MQYVTNKAWQEYLKDCKLDECIVSIRSQIEQNLVNAQNEICENEITDNINVYDTENFWKARKNTSNDLLTTFKSYVTTLHRCVNNEDVEGFELKKALMQKYMLLEENIIKTMESM